MSNRQPLTYEEFSILLDTPCQYCGLVGMKHPRSCQNYRSCDRERCDIQHSLFLRSIDFQRAEGRYEYECNLCSTPAIFSSVEIKQEPHPLCAKGVHYWTIWCRTCDPEHATCATCGIEKPVIEFTAEEYRIQNLLSRMSREAAETTVKAAMYGEGCVEGQVRARIEKEQQEKNDGSKTKDQKSLSD